MVIDPMVGRAAAASPTPVHAPASPSTPGASAAPEEQASDRQKFDQAMARPQGDPAAQNQFRQALDPATEANPADNPAADVPAVHRVDGAGQADLDSATHTPERLGDAILRGLDRAHTSYEHNVDRINHEVDKLGDNATSMSDLLRLQLDMTRFEVSQELAGKVADKASQGVQTLLKNQ